jgi:Leu/Phe-tRNA-protein transferase
MEKYKTIHENKVLINPPEDIEVIKKKMERLLQQGRNDEKLNEKYRNIIQQCNYCGQVKGKHKLSCGTQKVVVTLSANKG